MTNVGIYVRVSTDDKNQDPETQLLALRDFVDRNEGWNVVEEWVDQASALDMRRRNGWRGLMAAAAQRRIDLVLVYRLDRAFRSVPHAAATLEQLRAWKVGFRSFHEAFIDTTSPFGEALYYITVAYAGLYRGILSENVKDGMDRAKRQGKAIGRPIADVDVALAILQRADGMSWRQVQRAHPMVYIKGRRRRPGVETIRRAVDDFASQNGSGKTGPPDVPTTTPCWC
ncbi:MAG: Site-specific DNA recombinase [Chloroflexi bacterium]|jgi:DNA invertase Pin-like site-specific DNA recombinase|nr:MAG: Site-specific DNA recombinase [Chloroflexota bacterium]